MAKLFLVLVNVKFSHPEIKDEVAERAIMVRIVAFDFKHAEHGAMLFAEKIDPGKFYFKYGTVGFAYHAETIDVIGSVDCIGESIV